MRVVGIDISLKKDYNVETLVRYNNNGTLEEVLSIHIWNQELELTWTEYRRVDRSPNEGPLTDDLR